MFSFELPNEWWEAAGMRRFLKGDRHAYRRVLTDGTRILNINHIAVGSRGPGVPEFERDRMVSVLKAIRLDQALPPIEVTERDGIYLLYHGRHRLAASISVDFALVPAVIVRTMDDIKRSEGMA